MDNRYIAPSYSYARPLHHWLRARGLAPVPAPPAITARLVGAGEAVAGMTPLGSLIRGEGLKPCPGPMVYSMYTTLSVAVFSTRHRRLSDCPVVAVTPETRTSILYLAAILAEKNIPARIRRAGSTSYREVLREAPCALLIGDEALRAIAAGAYVLIDLGEAVNETLGITPVYAATASSTTCPPGLADPPWPTPSLLDALETSRATGLDQGLSHLYHYELLRLDYNPSALYDALELLEDVARELSRARPAALVSQTPMAAWR